MKRNLINIILLILVILLITSCVPTLDVDKCLPVDGKIYGFWNGLWHGLISWFSLIGSLFNDEITVYAFNNNGAWYNFGFLIGAGSTLSGTSSGVKRSRRKKVVINQYY